MCSFVNNHVAAVAEELATEAAVVAPCVAGGETAAATGRGGRLGLRGVSGHQR